MRLPLIACVKRRMTVISTILLSTVFVCCDTSSIPTYSGDLSVYLGSEDFVLTMQEKHRWGFPQSNICYADLSIHNYERS